MCFQPVPRPVLVNSKKRQHDMRLAFGHQRLGNVRHSAAAAKVYSHCDNRALNLSRVLFCLPRLQPSLATDCNSKNVNITAGRRSGINVSGLSAGACIPLKYILTSQTLDGIKQNAAGSIPD